MLSKLLQNTQRMIQNLEKQQDKIFKKSLKALNIKSSDPEATILFDYLFNKTWSAKETLKRISKSQNLTQNMNKAFNADKSLGFSLP